MTLLAESYCWFFLVIVLILYRIFSLDSTSSSAPINHSLFRNQKAFSLFESQSIPRMDELRDDLPLNQETYSLDQPQEQKKKKCSAAPAMTTSSPYNNDNDTITFMFESPNKIVDFEMKLMDIDSEHLDIPDAKYHAIVQMPSTKFARISAALVIRVFFYSLLLILHFEFLLILSPQTDLARRMKFNDTKNV